MKQKAPASLPEWASLTREICLALPFDHVRHDKERLALRRDFLKGLDNVLMRSRNARGIHDLLVFRESSASGLIRHIIHTHCSPGFMSELGPQFSDIDTYFLKGFSMKKLAEAVLAILHDKPVFINEFVFFGVSRDKTKMLSPSEVIEKKKRLHKKYLPPERPFKLTLEAYLKSMLIILKYIYYREPSSFSKEKIPTAFLKLFDRISLSPFLQREKEEMLIHDDVLGRSRDVLAYVRGYRARVDSVVHGDPETSSGRQKGKSSAKKHDP